MGFALKDQTNVRAWPSVRTPLGIQAELGCLMCGRTVADVVDGRIIQHAGCSGRLRVERGLIRCCHCNGPVYREPLNALAPR